MSRAIEHLDSVRSQMAYVLVAALLLFLTANDALASQYRCDGKGSKGTTVVEASSTAEAEYKAMERNPSEKFMRCKNLSLEQSEDIFVRDGRFRNQKHLSPYLPADLKESGKPRFSCDSAGGFLPDGSRDVGNCFELSSPSTKAIYKVRFSSGVTNGLTSQVWKRDGGGWKSWVEFHQTNLKSASADAQKYAAAHGAAQRDVLTTQQDPTTDTAAPPPTAESQIESVMKKGLGDLFKGFGR